MKICTSELGHMTNMAAMPINGKNLKKSSSPEPIDPWPWNLICSIVYGSTTMGVSKVKVILWPWSKVTQISKLKLVSRRNSWAIWNQNSYGSLRENRKLSNLVCSIVYVSTTKVIQIMTPGWPWLIWSQGQIWSHRLLYGKKWIFFFFFFLETIAALGLKVAWKIQLNEFMKLSECQRSRPFLDLG